MVVVELELDEETAADLAAEAETFEFESETAYLRWLVDHRSAVFDTGDELRERLSAIEERLDALEEAQGATGEDAGDPGGGSAGGDGGENAGTGNGIRDALDTAFEEAVGADDEEVSAAIAGVEALEDDD